VALTPRQLTIRAYGVGFGDCFLLTFHYGGSERDRHVLIDFGSTQRPPDAAANFMVTIADDIARIVGAAGTDARLDVLVATHRHTDHVSGFATRPDGKGPGDRIAALRPRIVIQPWTERPDTPSAAVEPASARASAGRPHAVDRALTGSLALMQSVAAHAMSEAAHLDRRLREEIQFLGFDGIRNKSAVRNLAKMGRAGKAVYAHYGSRLPLTGLLPGVRVRVLGPPTLKQKAGVGTQAAVNRDEYWHFHGFWRLAAGTAQLPDAETLFPRAPICPVSEAPPEARWFIRRVRRARGDTLLRIVRAMDSALNNTSLILLIEAGGKKLLFPGDAQWENWEYGLGKNAALLKGVDLYKVGHHGSLNATPKSLWKLFSRRGPATKRRRLTTLMSTRTDSKHGHRDNNTEVPRDPLVDELRRASMLRSTQELERSGALALTLTFDL
jgi:hypothetical protein